MIAAWKVRQVIISAVLQILVDPHFRGIVTINRHHLQPHEKMLQAGFGMRFTGGGFRERIGARGRRGLLYHRLQPGPPFLLDIRRIVRHHPVSK
jgi:hypothetical protein